MSVLSPDEIVEMTAILSALLGIAITWVIYYGSDRAELPGQAPIPSPATPEEPMVDNTGRTL
jgi:hypothetical protein